MDCCCIQHWQLSGNTPPQQPSGARISSAKNTLIIFICPKLHGVIRRMKYIKDQQLHINSVDMLLLYNGQQHVSATHLARLSSGCFL
jgi:hypothetical protein